MCGRGEGICGGEGFVCGGGWFVWVFLYINLWVCVGVAVSEWVCGRWCYWVGVWVSGCVCG